MIIAENSKDVRTSTRDINYFLLIFDFFKKNHSFKTRELFF